MYSDPIEKSTKKMDPSYIRIDDVKKYDKGIMFSEESSKSSTARELENINEALNEIKGKYSIKTDEDNYKSPLNITVLVSGPEIDFAKTLTRKENTKFIDCWVKSKDKGFYSIPYNYRPGTCSQQKQFNPDFIVKKGNKIIFVEIKHDEDTDIKNRDKIVGATDYFIEINKKLEKENLEYSFYFLTPNNYTGFFESVIRNNKVFMGETHADLLKKSRDDLKI